MAGDFKDLTGALFKNRRKTAEKHPDYPGTVRIRGEELRVAGWIRTPRGGGEKYMSLVLSEPQERRERTDGRAAAAQDDIPF